MRAPDPGVLGSLCRAARPALGRARCNNGCRAPLSQGLAVLRECVCGRHAPQEPTGMCQEALRALAGCKQARRRGERYSTTSRQLLNGRTTLNHNVTGPRNAHRWLNVIRTCPMTSKSVPNQSHINQAQSSNQSQISPKPVQISPWGQSHPRTGLD